MWLALLLNRQLPRQAAGARLDAAAVHHPTVLSTFAWRWMFDPTFSVLNWSLYQVGLHRHEAAVPVRRPVLALWCAIVVNTWRGMPFFAITLLAGLQTINPDLHEAASLDGANGWKRFWHVTWPLLKPVTWWWWSSRSSRRSPTSSSSTSHGGGPANSTHLFATYAYQIGVATGLLGEGAAISLFMLPVLFIVVWVQLRYLPTARRAPEAW